jgi:hypothetical protein
MYGIAQRSLDLYGSHIKNDASTEQWKVHAREDRKVEAIKAFRVLTGAGLKEAKDIVEAYAMDGVQMAIDRDNASGAVKTTKIDLANGSRLEVVDNGRHAQVLLTRHIGVNIRSEDLLQAIADYSLQYGIDR